MTQRWDITMVGPKDGWWTWLLGELRPTAAVASGHGGHGGNRSMAEQHSASVLPMEVSENRRFFEQQKSEKIGNACDWIYEEDVCVLELLKTLDVLELE